jgi:predicted transcriptional regulator
MTRRVADAMREPAVVVQPSTTIQETSARLLDAGVHTAVVLDGGVVCGLATAAQISAALSAGYDASQTTIGVIADRNPTMFRAEEALAEAHQQMRAEGSPIAAVVGPKREPLGLLEDSEAYPETGMA